MDQQRIERSVCEWWKAWCGSQGTTLQSTLLPSREWCSLARCKSRPSTRLSGNGTHTCMCIFKHTQQVYRQTASAYMKDHGAQTWRAVFPWIYLVLSFWLVWYAGVGQASLRRTLLIRRKSVWFSAANVDSYENVYLPGWSKCIS